MGTGGRMIQPPTGTRPLILNGHVLDMLRQLPDECVQVVVTSPPYWGLRSYGTEPQVWGGDPAHLHDWTQHDQRIDETGSARNRKGLNAAAEVHDGGPRASTRTYPTIVRESAICSCGAWRGELGAEPTPELYVEHLVAIFREVRRVLRTDGTVWLNLGDSYASKPVGSYNGESNLPNRDLSFRPASGVIDKVAASGLKAKDLVGIPWTTAFALRSDGWWLRSGIVWAKRNCMPESIRDRPTQAHEFIFLLTKSSRYFYDNDAVRNDLSESSEARLAQPTFWEQEGGDKDYANGVNPNRSTRRALENLAKRSGYAPSTLQEVSQGYDGAAIKDYDGTGAQDGSSVKKRIIDGVRRRDNGRRQSSRAWELFEAAGLTDAHLEAIRSAGISDAGKALVTQGGAGKNDSEVVRLTAEAKAALGGYYREFLLDISKPAGAAIGSNLRSWWLFPTQPFKDAHFATFPEEIPRRAILLGTSEHGACAKCGTPWNREVERIVGDPRPTVSDPEYKEATGIENPSRNPRSPTEFFAQALSTVRSTAGWSPACSCDTTEVVPCLIMDIFSGSGTTLAVARRLGRRSIGIDLNSKYVDLMVRRPEVAGVDLEQVW